MRVPLLIVHGNDRPVRHKNEVISLGAPYRILYQGAARGAGRWIIRLAHLLDGRFGPGRQKKFLRAFQAWDQGVNACDRKLPPCWRCSVAVFAYEPPEDQQRSDDFRVSYLKVSCTITGFQIDGKMLLAAPLPCTIPGPQQG